MAQWLRIHTGDASLIPGWGRSPRGGNGNPLQYSCLEKPMDRGAWQAAIHGVTKSQTQLSMHAVTNEAGQFCMFMFLFFICISSLKYLLTSFAYFSLGHLFSYN